MSSKDSELILTTCQTGLQWSACLWDTNTGNARQIYKNGGTPAHGTLNLLGHDYVLFAEDQKPLLSLFPVNSQEQTKNVKLILPEPAKVVGVSPNNFYMACGIGLKLYVWHLPSGKLLSVQQKHFQAISCIKFSSTCDFIAVGGKDGILVVYNFEELISLDNSHLPQNEMGVVEPKYKKLDHTLPINDMHMGTFGSKARLCTVSSDQTCKIYALQTGEQLLNLVFTEALTSVVLDSVGWNLFIGNTKGEIDYFNLKEPPRQVTHHVKNENSLKFIGHKNKITSLKLNETCDILASASDDSNVIIWGVKSRQILRILEHKAPITNILFVSDHKNFSKQNLKPLIQIKSLERSLVSISDDYIVSVVQNSDISCPFDKDSAQEEKIYKNSSKYDDLESINKQLYLKLQKFNELLHNKK